MASLKTLSKSDTGYYKYYFMYISVTVLWDINKLVSLLKYIHLKTYIVIE